MTWIRIDDKLTTHPKWLMLSSEAKLWWFHAAVWCGAHNNDGIIPEHAYPLVAMTAGVEYRKTPKVIEELCKRPSRLPSDDVSPSALMARVPKARGGGVEFHDWETYQPTKKQVRKKGEVDALAAEMRRLHDWFHKSAPGKKVKTIVELRDGATCCYCGEGPLRTDGDRKGSTRRTFDLIDPESRSTWEWGNGEMLRPMELARVSDLWCVACGYCNGAKGKRAPDETDGYRIMPGRGPFADLPRSTAIQSALNLPLGTDLPRAGDWPVSGLVGAGSGRVGSDALGGAL